jgi:hypothetical protein
MGLQVGILVIAQQVRYFKIYVFFFFIVASLLKWVASSKPRKIMNYINKG